MPPTDLEQLRAEVRATKAVRDVGRVTEVSRGTVQVSGISSLARRWPHWVIRYAGYRSTGVRCWAR